MIKRFQTHNLFWNDINDFLLADPQLKALENVKHKHKFELGIDYTKEALHLLYGPRQLGKSTTIKLLIKELILEKNIATKNIFYLACELLQTRSQLEENIRSFINQSQSNDLLYIFLDEITYIDKWALSIKALSDEGLFFKSLVLITGSDVQLLKESKVYFPGFKRRGKWSKNIELKPLTFPEYLNLVDKSSDNNYENLMLNFSDYINSGGFPAVINAYKETGFVEDYILSIYADWIIGHFIKIGKSEEKLIECLSIIYPRIASKITFSNLANKCNFLSLPTLIEYIETLEKIGFLKVVSALNPNTLNALPKKAKKIHLRDSLFFKVIDYILNSKGLISKKDEIETSIIVEGIAYNHFERDNLCYYFKADGEVDLTIVFEGSFIPIEIKWTNQTRVKDLKQLKKLKKPFLLRKEAGSGNSEGVSYLSLVETLVKSKEYKNSALLFLK